MFIQMGRTRQRHLEILAIVRDAAVHSQDELLVRLRKKGFRVTQPTLSRDIRALGLVKTPIGWILPDQVGPDGARSLAAPEHRQQRLDKTIRATVISAVAAGQLVVAKTPPGSAQLVARAFDEAEPAGVVGTVGGDDTLFIAMKSAAGASTLAQRVRALLAGEARRRRTSN
jgi:transcriptional regulator of arginine metabolism